MKKLLLSLALFCVLTGSAHAQTPSAPSYTPITNGQINQGVLQQNTFCERGSCTYIPLEPLPGLPSSYGPNSGSGTFGSYIGNIFNLLIGAGAIIAVVMIVLGALTYMFSDVIGNKTKALSRIRNAMWAIVLLVSSYLILFTINPELVKFNLNLNPAAPVNTTQTTTNSATPQASTKPTPQEITECQNSSINTNVCAPKYDNPDGSWRCSCTTGV